LLVFKLEISQEIFTSINDNVTPIKVAKDVPKYASEVSDAPESNYQLGSFQDVREQIQFGYLNLVLHIWLELLLVTFLLQVVQLEIF